MLLLKINSDNSLYSYPTTKFWRKVINRFQRRSVDQGFPYLKRERKRKERNDVLTFKKNSNGINYKFLACHNASD